MTKRTSFCVVTCVKNEGPFLLEWVAYCQSIGVTDFLIFSNDCDDFSDAILNRLDDMGIVRHLPNPSVVNNSSQHHRTALAYAPLHKEFQNSDYIVIIDCDEFIVSTVGDGSLTTLVEDFGSPDVISLSELNFGFGGNLKFKDKLVTQQFRRARDKNPPPDKVRRGVKSIMKRTENIKEFANHRPIIQPDAVEAVVWRDGSGALMPPQFVKNYKRGINCTGRYQLAWLNHYTLRSGESMLTKFERGDAVRGNRLNEQYFINRNGREAEYFDIDANMSGLKKQLKKLLGDKILADLHEKSVVAHKAKITALKSNPNYGDNWEKIVEAVEETNSHSTAMTATQATSEE